MMEVERIADQLLRAHDGNAWHGPAVAEILAGVSAADAAERPFSGRHSIWEILGHIAAWERVVCRRIRESSAIDPTPEENFPAVPDVSEPAWKRAMTEADRTFREFHATILKLSDDALDSTVRGKSYSLYIMLHGAVQHTLYHAGQMALLKRASPRA